MTDNADFSSLNCRNFNLYTSLISHVYLIASAYNNIFGNKLPSSFMHLAGPAHQFSFFLLIAYYQGNVFGDRWGALAVVNVIYVIVVSVFCVDTVIKSWCLALYPTDYQKYVKKWKKKEDENGNV